VVKASGLVEDFDGGKIVESLVRIGLTRSQAESVLSEVESGMPPHVTTDAIYEGVVEVLRREYPSKAPVYMLKRAIMMLGPSGYPFEKYFALLLRWQGYSVSTNLVLRGRCVSHEVDVAAEKDGKKFMVECKYHNSPGYKTDVKVTLYVYARFLDLEAYFNCAWVATNTKLTEDAKRYAECVGMQATAWRYPPDGSLEAIIERSRLYPITVLSTVDKQSRRKLLDSGIVTVSQVVEAGADKISGICGIPPAAAEQVVSEASLLL